MEQSQSNQESQQAPHFNRSQSTDGTNVQRLGFHNPLNLPPLSRSTSLNSNNASRGYFQRRTVEGARQLRDHVMREIQPLMETAATVNISNFLNRPHSEPNIQNTTSNSYVVNLEPAEPELAQPVNIPEEEEPQENAEIDDSAEAQEAMGALRKYIPFILILLGKCLYDHHEGIFNIVILFIMFAHANSAVKKEATKRGQRSISRLLFTLVYIILGIVLFNYIFGEEKLYLNLIFIRTYDYPLTVWDLLWFVGITDFILKLITIAAKVVLTLLPAIVVPFQKRGKIYLFMEGVSQMYRGLATIQPWLFYLLDSYQGTEKIVGAFLTAAYMVSKGADLMTKAKLLKTAIFKLLQNVTVGSSPSKEQIQTAGEHCPICHDEYDSPVLLQCRHIFCESCVTTWFDREQTCPLCRSKIVDDPSWRDGSTSFFIQLF